MEINVITFTDEQYAALSETQLQEVYKAQEKKDRLTWNLEEDKRKEKRRLVTNGTYASKLWDMYCAKLDAQYEREVSFLREALLFYLRFSMKPGEDSSSPYEVNYALTIEERVAIVKAYYETQYTNPNERFAAFNADKVAVQYIGEMYAPMWDYFYFQMQE